jgi:hypothetical protein
MTEKPASANSDAGDIGPGSNSRLDRVMPLSYFPLSHAETEWPGGKSRWHPRGV